jgi:acyl-CoA thioesterase YciA
MKPKGELTLQTIAMPADTNGNGDIFGGWLMSQMDLGTSVMARRRAEGRVATVAVDSMTFLKPVHVGDLVSIYAELVGEGRTSVTIEAEVWVERLASREQTKMTEGRFVFVAIDDDGEKRVLPAIGREM